MWISKYICLFMIYSFFGWIYETIFCTVKEGKWENRGFLYGPVCPIYGTGAVLIIAIINLTKNTVELNIWQLFIISVFGSAILEYVTSWVLEKLFHAVWWDYSSYPLNLQGRISLFTSLGFGFGGLFIVYILKPFTENLMTCFSPLITELLALLFIALFMIDLTLTVTALIHFDKFVIHIEDTFNKSMESFVENTVQTTEQIKQGINIRKYYTGNLNKFTKATVKRINKFKYKSGGKNDVS